MPPPPMSGESRDVLMRHLDSLFAFAQIVAPNAEEAVRLVQETYRRAFISEADFENDEQARIWLFKLLATIRREADQPSVESTSPIVGQVESSPQPTSSERSTGGVELADFRRRLLDEYIDRTLPQAFSMLSSEQRMLLMLCDVEHLRCEDAGAVLRIDPAYACGRLDEARIALKNAVYAGATNLERHLLETGLVSGWRRNALQRMVRAELVTTPPTLGPAVVSLFGEASQQNRPEIRPALPHRDAEYASGALTWQGLVRKFVLILSIILVAGLLGYGFTRVTTREPDRNLISLSARQADSIEPTFQTTNAEQAERYIRDRLNVRITIPTIEGATLRGLSIRTLVEDANVPVLLYHDSDSIGNLTIYVYTYAFLDRHVRHLVLDRDVLRQIEDEGNFDLHDLGSEKALIWRNRDDIFVAITDGDAEALRGRIAFPS